MLNTAMYSGTGEPATPRPRDMVRADRLENNELTALVTALGSGLGKNFDISRLRYGRIIILADADSDGHHIATLLLTFMYRHMPGLISAGRVFLAQPPLYRIDVGKDTFWALDDAHRDRILKLHGNGRGKPEITRFKGLGEMMPKVLWETTLNPRTRACCGSRLRTRSSPIGSSTS